MTDRPFLYPNVTSVPGSTRLDGERVEKKKPEGFKSDFDQVFDQTLDGAAAEKSATGIGSLDRAGGLKKDLGSIQQPLKFSAHASQRLLERKIQLDPSTLSRVSEAVDRAEAKGIEDTLVLTSEAALIVNVKNRTVITAMDKQSLNGNVFTNIDGAVIV